MIQVINNHRVECKSIEEVNFNELMNGEKAHILYTDPPWGDGNMKYWVTINKRQTNNDFVPLSYDRLIEIIKGIIINHVDGWVFVETGNQWLESTLKELSPYLHNVKVFNLNYKSGSKTLKNPVIVGSTRKDQVFTGNLENCLDSESLEVAIPLVKKDGAILLDPCCGMGNSARAAVKNGMRFYGNEFNVKRIQKTINSLK